MEDQRKGAGYWSVIVLIIVLIVFATIGSITKYKQMEKLQDTGTRVMVAVDSVAKKGSRTSVFVTLRVNGQEYPMYKEVLHQVALGDSVPVYYLPNNPANHDIGLE